MNNVDHPQHYTQYKHEVIELAEQFDFCIGNAIKYILRAPFKGHKVEDYQKALWYLKRAKYKGWEVRPKTPELIKLTASYENIRVADLVCAVTEPSELVLVEVMKHLEQDINEAKYEDLQRRIDELQAENTKLKQGYNPPVHWDPNPSYIPTYTSDRSNPEDPQPWWNKNKIIAKD